MKYGQHVSTIHNRSYILLKIPSYTLKFLKEHIHRNTLLYPPLFPQKIFSRPSFSLLPTTIPEILDRQRRHLVIPARKVHDTEWRLNDDAWLASILWGVITAAPWSIMMAAVSLLSRHFSPDIDWSRCIIVREQAQKLPHSRNTRFPSGIGGRKLLITCNTKAAELGKAGAWFRRLRIHSFSWTDVDATVKIKGRWGKGEEREEEGKR